MLDLCFCLSFHIFFLPLLIPFLFLSLLCCLISVFNLFTFSSPNPLHPLSVNILFLLHSSLSTSTSLPVFNAMWQRAHSLSVSRRQRRYSSQHVSITCGLFHLIAQYVGHPDLQLSGRAVLVFAALHFFILYDEKDWFVSYSSRFERFFLWCFELEEFRSGPICGQEHSQVCGCWAGTHPICQKIRPVKGLWKQYCQTASGQCRPFLSFSSHDDLKTT